MRRQDGKAAGGRDGLVGGRTGALREGVRWGGSGGISFRDPYFLEVRVRRAVRGLVAMAVLAGVGGCTSSESPGEDANIFAVRFDLVRPGGTQTVRVGFDGLVTGGPITLPTNQDVTFTAQALRPDNSPDPVVTPATYELRLTPSVGTVTFTRSGSFTGTLRASAAGASTVSVRVVRLADGDTFFGPVNVNVAAAAP